MTTERLIEELKKSEVILPKDFLQHTDADTLVRQVIKIFEDHKDELERHKDLQRNYLELVNYLYVVSLNKKTTKQKKSIFSDNLINGLLSLPDPA